MVRGGSLRNIISCYPRKTCIGQIHGHPALRVPSTQDAGTQGSTFPARRFEEIIRLQHESHGASSDYLSAKFNVASLHRFQEIIPVRTLNPREEVRGKQGQADK